MTRRLLTLGILAAAVAVAVPAYAQLPQGRRPYSGLFGGSASDARNAQGLNLTGSLGGGYDIDRNQNPPGFGTGTVPLRTGSYGIGAASLSYGLQEGIVSGSLYASGRARYYPNVSDPIIGTFAFGGNLAVPIGTRLSVDTTHSAGVFVRGADFFGNYGDLGNSGLAGADYTLGAVTSVGRYASYRSSVGANAKATQHLSFYGRYDYYANDLLQLGAGTGRYNAIGWSGGVSYALLKTVSLRAGYTRTQATTGAAAGQVDYGMRSFDGGVDFNKALSLTRRSTLTFSTGMSGIADQAGSVRYVFTGRALYIYELGRSWTLNGEVSRNTDFYAAFAQPTIMDRGNVSVSGLLSRRMQVSTVMSLIKSEALAPVVVSGYTAGHTGVSMKYALNRELALSADYSYYRYRFDDPALVPPGAFAQINRHSVRVSLDLWVPLLTRTKRGT